MTNAYISTGIITFLIDNSNLYRVKMTATPPESASTPPDTDSTTPPPTIIDIPSFTDERKTLLIAISGPSCSGKTTLSRLLRDAIPRCFIIHEDDFYKTDAEIPIKRTSDGRDLQDWDCFESIDYQKLLDTVRYVKTQGRLPAGFESMEDRNAVGHVDVDEAAIEQCRQRLASTVPPHANVVILDGFLLFSTAMAELLELFDCGLLLRADHDTVRSRREARKGYVTLEGFWEDPDGYVDQIVWPNYVQDHKHLFVDRNVEGEPADDALSALRIEASPSDAGASMTKLFTWAVDVLDTHIARTCKESD